jgi:hypothetical protein
MLFCNGVRSIAGETSRSDKVAVSDEIRQLIREMSIVRSAARVSSTGAPASASMNAQPLGRIIGVERQIGAPGLEDAEQPHQHRPVLPPGCPA